MSRRDEQEAATRTKFMDAAFDVLATRGHAAPWTLAVQRAAVVGRGALLHDFPTRFESGKIRKFHVAEIVRDGGYVALPGSSALTEAG